MTRTPHPTLRAPAVQSSARFRAQQHWAGKTILDAPHSRSARGRAERVARRADRIYLDRLAAGLPGGLAR